jgi:RNA polymerase sigma factor (sigma-70 family)
MERIGTTEGVVRHAALVAGLPATASLPWRASAVFEETYLEHAPLLRKIAIRRFGIARAEAETLVHDVFATYLTHASSVRATTPYLVGAICNASRQYLRRAHAETVLFCGEVPCAATPGEALTEEVHRKIILSRVLARIGKRCRDLFHRYYMQGETSRQIADAFDTTPATILVFLHTCRRRARAACWTFGDRG